MVRCPNCGYEQEEMINECLRCGLVFSNKESVEGKPERLIPWEERKDLGLFKAIFETVKSVLFSPTNLFSQMRIDTGISDPLLYAVIIGTVCNWIALLWQIPLQGFLLLISPDKEDAIINSCVMIGIAILMPLFIAIGLFIWAGILHLCLMLVGGNKKGFEATFRVVAYATSTQVGAIVPLCGGLIAGIWGLVVYIIGLREIHQTTTLKAILAVFIPIIAVCLAGMIIFAFTFLTHYISTLSNLS